MKTFTTATALGILGAAAFAGPALAGSSATATTDLNVRSGPGPQYEVVDVIPGSTDATLLGCMDGSKWCQVSHDGRTGWAYSDYLVANNAARPTVVTEYRTTAQVPVVAYEDASGGAAAGAVGGTITGALVGGPVGATVGGAAGATVGAAIDPPAPVRTYVVEHQIEPVYLEGEVVTGATVPEPVVLQPVPEYDYSYTYVNRQPVLVDPQTRQIVYVVR